MEYNKESLKQLLSQINTINEAYKIVKKNTGEDFNIFGILGMERKEVKTHSRILAELLDPKGSHLQGNIFLKLFIDYLNNVKINNGNDNLNLLTEDSINLNVENSNVFIEKYIGEKTLGNRSKTRLKPNYRTTARHLHLLQFVNSNNR